MTSKLDKLKDLARIGLEIGIQIPGSARVRRVADLIKRGIADKSDPDNENSLRVLGAVNDAQTEVLQDHEDRLREIEKELQKQRA